MGLLDSIMSAVSSQVQQQGGLAQVVSGLLANNGEMGGLGGLATKFQQAGMGDVIASWIGKGQNLPISADQISQVLGSGAMGDIASKLGIDSTEASGQLAQMLPGLIDKLTPHGVAPEGGLGNAGDLVGMLGGLLQQR